MPTHDRLDHIRPVRPMTRFALAALALALSLAGCGGAGPVLDQLNDAPPAAKTDPVGAKPALAAPKPFVPPTPTALELAQTPPVWLIERHDVPLVAVHVVIPYGAAVDPTGKGGLAALTAEMMEQGAGRRGALEIGRAAERLGADLTVGADRDASSARLVVLAENLEPALALLADVVARPRFEADEFTRTHSLWRAQLESRAFDPSAVAGVVTAAALYGPEHPYGHPVDGTTKSVDTVTLDDVKSFHRRHWRPDRATLVVVGDVTPEALGALLPAALKWWVADDSPPPVPTAPAAPSPRPITALVARPDSPQTMLVVARPGPAAADAVLPVVELVNIPLGASFTSRLNQNLREDKGYTYGARSRVPFTRGAGPSIAGAAVQSEVTTEALRELLGELRRMNDGGPTEDELQKARATAQNRDVQAYEEVAATADRLAEIAGLGLGPDADARAAQTRATADLTAAKAASALLPAPDGVIIAVGDPAVVQAAVTALERPAPIVYTPEGEPQPAAPASPE